MKKALRTVYNQIPFKQPFFELIKKVWHPSPGVFRHLHFKGVFKVPISGTESFKIRHYGFELENELFWEGITSGWEKVSIGLWTRLCRKSGVILDIGANTGVYSLVAKAVNPAARVYAFEPVERVYNKLVDNTRLNQYDIACYKKAVSNYSGEAVIYDTGGEHVYSVTVNKNIHDPSMQVQQSRIETITLKQFIEEQQISGVDLVKIDVETHEPEVLEGFGEYLKVFRPTMFVEVLNDEAGHKINQLVQDLDYLYFNIDENKGLRRVEKIGRSDYFNYLLCSEAVAKELNLIDPT